MNIPRIFIGAVKGGSGKTLISLGLCAFFVKKGLRVSSFKKGPDFIDAAWLSFASKSQCYNLDLYLMTEGQVLESFYKNSIHSDISVIEGNRGFYDYSLDIEDSSSARLCKLLKAPLVLVIDCTKMTRTAASIVLGIKAFDPDISINGVILNNISGSRHEKVIRHEIEYHTGVKVLGSIPRMDHDPLPMRHLGVRPVYETESPEVILRQLTEIVEKYMDYEGVLRVAHDAPRLQINLEKDDVQQSTCDVTIGILLDESFQFYYPENIESLKKQGARLVFINSMIDINVNGIDCLYIGGGFPETNAERLVNNYELRRSLREKIERGLPVYAECGGLIYLGRNLIYKDRTFEMLDILPLDFVIDDKPVGHGYSEMNIERDSLFFRCGERIKGHEFHYSRPILVSNGKEVFFTASMVRGKGIIRRLDGIYYKNTFATYTHIHSLTHPSWAKRMVDAARSMKVNFN